METKFNFNSQVCTDVNQSRRLLELGLKKETADFPVWGTEGLLYMAWSLHRLIEMALRDILICGISFTFNEDAYEKVIRIIEHQIKEGYFNKEYLV